MSDEKDSTVVRLLVFDGKPTSWVTWQEKFLARATKKGYYNILCGNEKEFPIRKELDDWDPEDEDDASTVDGVPTSSPKKLSPKEVNAKVKTRETLLKKCGDLNIQAYSDLILHIDDRTAVGRCSFQGKVSQMW